MIKIGCDLISNSRLGKQLSNWAFLKRVFYPSELKLAKNKLNKLAGIFALKEATMKALGKKLDWKDIEIKIRENKKSVIFLANSVKPKNFKYIDGTISHDGDYTLGFVIIELK